MSEERSYDLHGPFCPNDCLINVEYEDIHEILPDVKKEQLEALKVGAGIHTGPDEDYRICRRKR